VKYHQILTRRLVYFGGTQVQALRSQTSEPIKLCWGFLVFKQTEREGLLSICEAKKERFSVDDFRFGERRDGFFG